MTDYDFGFPREILNNPEKESAIWNNEDMNNVIEYLAGSFDWTRTKEGAKFWREIYERMLRIKRHGN